MAIPSEKSNALSNSRVEQGVLGDSEWEEVGYRGPQVCAIVGITYRQLDYWARTELLRPSLSDAQGSGSKRRYSYLDLVALKVIKNLLDAGVSLKTARKAIDYLREHLGEDVATASLVIDENKSVLARNGEDIFDLVRHGQGVLNIVPLGSVVRQIDAGITELHPIELVAPVEERDAAQIEPQAGLGS